MSWILQAVFLPLKVRPPATASVLGIMGQDLDISNRHAKEELGWKTHVPWDEARASIEKWVQTEYS
ncbi:MAG: hypothetical protein SWK76_08150 [Actinomycetota bacterium]|nr:hypothetical protein [Actinomycetota bacterium]